MTTSFAKARVGGALMAAFTLSGCAAVIPLAAAGAMTNAHVIRGDDTSDTRNSGAALSAEESIPALDDQAAGVVVSDLTELPPPSGRSSQLAELTVASFADYAKGQAATETALGARLVEPELMRPRRAECGGRPPVVVVDLDPGEGTVDPFEPLPTQTALATALVQLRETGIAVAWQSRLGDGFGQPLRHALAEAGLDPTGTDMLLLLPSIDERKQTQREALDASHCIVAMLGDERADFDELFLYLKNPDAAIGLDRMIGEGWFLLEGVAQGETSE